MGGTKGEQFTLEASDLGTGSRVTTVWLLCRPEVEAGIGRKTAGELTGVDVERLEG